MAPVRLLQPPLPLAETAEPPATVPSAWSAGRLGSCPGRAGDRGDRSGRVPVGAGIRVAFCPDAIGPFSVQGTKAVGQGGKTFVSYGITVPGLLGPNRSKFVKLDLEKIAATAIGWCGNTVRLQLSQDELLGVSGTGFNKADMNGIQDEVWRP